jgi:hypothetical protein
MGLSQALKPYEQVHRSMESFLMIFSITVQGIKKLTCTAVPYKTFATQWMM